MGLFPLESWALSVVDEGVRLTFLHPPPLSTSPQWISVPKNATKAAALRQEVSSLLQKHAVEIVQHRQSPGFYSHLFVVPKPGGRWRPVIDLSVLNRHLVIPKFKMETARALRKSIRPNDFAVSIDLSDAYLHVPMHRATRRYLRFAIDDVIYAFRALPFGLSISPWVFTRLMEVLIMHVRRHTVSEISHYLDDCLQKNQDPLQLKQDLAFFLQLLEEVGFLVNRGKSELTPSMDFVHLGMHFRTQVNLVYPTDKRIQKLIDMGSEILHASSFTPRGLHRFLGMCVATADLVPLGGLQLRPVQWAISDLWDQRQGNWDQPILLSNQLLDAVRIWINRNWLETGVPILPASPSVSLCTDAAGMGWGAHLLPSFLHTAGLWTDNERLLHSNDKEMLAVLKAVQAWATPLANQPLMILSDNRSVCSYINRQGGTRSRSLCLKTIELLQFCHPLGITLQARHLPGRLNVIADGLSRQRPLHTEWALNPAVFQSILGRFPQMSVDLFATRYNHKLPLFVSPFPDSLALAIDGLAFNWLNRDLYAFPPTSLIPLILIKMEQTPCFLTLIAPLQWRRSWITPLLRLCTEIPRKLPLIPDLLIQPISGSLHGSLESLNLHVFRLSSHPSEGGATLPLLSTEFCTQGGPPL